MEAPQSVRSLDLVRPLVIRFDLPLLKAEITRAGLVWPEEDRNLVDAHIIYQEKERRDLTAAVKFYCGDDLADAHSALADVRATRRVVEAQIRRYPDLPNSVDGLGNFCREARFNRFADSGYWFAWESGMLIFAKSKKHKGESLLEVAKCDSGFLQWMLTKGFPEDTQRLVREALSGAGQRG